MTVRVIHDDCLAVIPKLVSEGVLVDACVTDAPYHLTATIKRFGAVNAAPAQEGRDGAMRRLSGGFMNQQWDGGDIAFRPETWATVASIMRPGAFLVAFGGTRTHHRVWCAIEDGGFVIQDTIMWLFGSGFPKRRDHLKPAFEPVCLAYKPGGKRTMQVDECRIGTERIWEYPNGPKGNTETSIIYGGGKGLPRREEPLSGPQGRWPANICHDGSDEVIAAFPDSDSARASGNPNNPRHGENNSRTSWEFGPLKETNDYRDRGSAARFFFSAPQAIPCALCGWPCDEVAGINAVCNAPVSSVVDPSSQPGINPNPPDFAQNDVPVSTLRASADTPNLLSGHAPNVASRSPQCHQPTALIAAENVPDWPLSKIVQNVRSAAHLCGLCATAIAQSLVASRLGRDQEPLHFQASIGESQKQILTRSLALYVAGRESTDTILTTQSLSELFGSVFHAIAENINSERSAGKVNIGSGQRRFHFSSKAQKSDRWGSRHPTVKPVELMKWLVQLVTPPGGLVLDPFAGSGTTGAAALATGRSAILIEREEAYVADIRERIAFYEGEGRHSLAAKARRTPDKPLGGLFDATG